MFGLGKQQPAAVPMDPFGAALLDEGFWYAPVGNLQRVSFEHTWIQGIFGTDPGGSAATIGYVKVDGRPYLTFTYFVLGKNGKPEPGSRPVIVNGIFLGGVLPRLEVTLRRGEAEKGFVDGRYAVSAGLGAEPLVNESLASLVPMGMTHYFTGFGWLFVATSLQKGAPTVPEAVAGWAFLDAAINSVGGDTLAGWSADFGEALGFFEPVHRLFPSFERDAFKEGGE